MIWLVAISLALAWGIAVLGAQGNDIERDVKKINTRMDSLNTALQYGVYGEYQLTVDQDSIYLWDRERYVGGCKLSYDEDPISTIIMEDNE